MGAGTDREAGRSFSEDDRWRVLLTVTPDAQPTMSNLGISNGAGVHPSSLLLGADQGKGEAGWPRILQMEAGGHRPE